MRQRKENRMIRKQLKHAAVAITLILTAAAAVSTPNPAWAAPIPANTASIKTAASAPISGVYYRRGYYGRGHYGRGYYGRGYYGRGYYGRPYGAYGYPYGNAYPYYSYPYAYPYLGFGFGWGGW